MKGRKSAPPRLKIQVFNPHPTRHVDGNRLRDFASRVLAGEDWGGQVDVGIILGDDAAIQELNRQFAHKDSPTDVLAFPLSDDLQVLEGEIYVSLDRAAEQAVQYQESFENEVARLIAHGLLHLLGYKDNAPDRRKKMQEMEDYYLSKGLS